MAILKYGDDFDDKQEVVSLLVTSVASVEFQWTGTTIGMWGLNDS